MKWTAAPLAGALILALTLSAMLPAPGLAAEVAAFVDRNRVGPGESVGLTVAITDGDGDVDTSPIRDFKVMSRGSATSLRIVNGATSRETRYNYVLAPLKDGALAIPPLTVTVNGARLQTRPIAVTVAPGGAEDAESKEVFVEAAVSDAAPYAGEPIIYTFRLFRSTRIANARFAKPDFAGFVAEPIGEERNREATLQGRRFQVTEIDFALAPMAAGDAVIAPAVLEFDALRPGRRRGGFGIDSIFGDPFFGGNLESRTLRTEPISVTVRPLPPYSGDAPFSGLVGRFDMSAELKPNRLAAGESATLTLTVSGTGNIMDARPPDAAPPADIKTYADAPEPKISLTPAGYSGRKIFRSALVPLAPGDYTIPVPPLVYFDPEAGAYRSRTAAPLSLSVAPSETLREVAAFAAPETGAGTEKRKVDFTGRDILPIKDGLEALQTHRPMPLQWFLILMGLPPLLALATLAGLRLARPAAGPAARMARRANRELKAAAGDGLSDIDFSGHLYRAVISAALALAGREGESLTDAEADAILIEAGHPPETAGRVTDLLERVSSARYGGAALDAGRRAELLAEARDLARMLTREARGEARAEAKREAKREARAEAKREAKAEAKREAKAEAKREARGEAGG